MTHDWQIYESAASIAVEMLRTHLGIQNVEGKQRLDGVSGVTWEVDARAWCSKSEKFVVIEARRHTTSGIKQKDIAALALQIQDLGAKGGIIVSPLPLQKGAKVLAERYDIEHVVLHSDSTPERMLAEYMGRRFHLVELVEEISVSTTLIGGELNTEQ